MDTLLPLLLHSDRGRDLFCLLTTCCNLAAQRTPGFHFAASQALHSLGSVYGTLNKMHSEICSVLYQT